MQGIDAALVSLHVMCLPSDLFSAQQKAAQPYLWHVFMMCHCYHQLTVASLNQQYWSHLRVTDNVVQMHP